MRRAALALVMVVLAAGCATPDAPGPSTPSTLPTPAGTEAPATVEGTTASATPSPPPTPPAVPRSPHDASDPGLPAEKRPFAVPAWLPSDHLAFEADAYDVRERTVHGTRVVVAAHEDLATLEPEPGAFAAFAWEAFDAQWDLFGGHLYEEARIVLRGPEEPCAFRSATPVGFVVCAQEHATSPDDRARPPHPLSDDRIPELVLHEMLHMWIGGAFASVPRNVTGFPVEAWFTEGATTYLAARLQDDGGSERAMAGERRTYEGLLPEVGGLSFAQLAERSAPPGGPPDPHTRMLYARGALVTALLDAELAARGASLDALLARMYREHALAGEPWGVDDLRAHAEAVAGVPLDAFFERYVDGAEPIPEVSGPPRAPSAS